ncbi:MAG: glycoside hydrolase family 65 protein, partial [Bacteroidota bacterium]
MERSSLDEHWRIQTNSIDPNHYFGAMVANGMIGLISAAQPMQIKEVVLNGVYDRYQRGRVSNILKGFNPLNLELVVNGVALEMSSVQDYRQELDLKKARLLTRLETTVVVVEHELLALRHLPYTAMVRVSIQAKTQAHCTIANALEAPNHLRNIRNLYSEIDRPHVKIPLMTSVADSPTGRVQLAATNSYLFAEAHGSEPHLIHEDWDENRHLVKWNKGIEAGESYEFALVSSICTSTHFSDPQNEAERLSIYAKLEGQERLLKRHFAAWETLWKSDIEIEGNLEVQRETRLMLYYLYASAREGTALSLSPVGLSGLGYNGHVFWDTELWMFPPLLVMHPAIAKSLLDYRFERLEAAKQNAFNHGYKGAMFPWESADDGTEQTPVWALTGPFQQHITACVGWAFWKYYQVTQDKAWLREKGFVVLQEVATFWCSRVEREGSGQYHIRNVIGANEFEENIDDNAFTNGIVKIVLENAVQAAQVLGLVPDPDWLHVAEN